MAASCGHCRVTIACGVQGLVHNKRSANDNVFGSMPRLPQLQAFAHGSGSSASTAQAVHGRAKETAPRRAGPPQRLETPSPGRPVHHGWAGVAPAPAFLLRGWAEV